MGGRGSSIMVQCYFIIIKSEQLTQAFKRNQTTRKCNAHHKDRQKGKEVLLPSSAKCFLLFFSFFLGWKINGVCWDKKLV